MNQTETTVHRRTLARATEIAGGQERLAQFLGLAPDQLREWAEGKSEPPLPVFLALTDIVAANFLTPVALANLDAERQKRGSTKH